MDFCGKCGSKLEENLKFCPVCGTSAEVGTKQTVEHKQQTNYAAKASALNNTADTTDNFDVNDIAQNKTMAVLAYIIFLIPLLAAKDSKFARYHTNQGIVLAIAAVAYGIVYSILCSIILTISWRLYFLITIIGLVGIVFAVLMIIGIINAVGGKAKELPVIGKIRILK